MKRVITSIFFLITLWFCNTMFAQETTSDKTLTNEHKHIISIAAYTAKGDLTKLTTALHAALNDGMTINKTKEILVHTYAYCGFPRSIRGIQTLLAVVEERKAKGINDKEGAEVSAINGKGSKYERGKKILSELVKSPQGRPTAAYAKFAPIIDSFTTEHLFADIFERDILTYAERELVTISVISAIGNAEPMLRSHFSISMNTGFTPDQLNEFIDTIKSLLGKRSAKNANKVLKELLKSDNN